MQSSSAQVTMMESQNRKRAPAWTEREVRDLIAVWREESVLSELRSSFRNAKTFVKISQGMKDRGHNRDPKQCRVKLKELRQAYQKTREANGRSGSESQTCRFYDELHAILGGSATTTPAVLFDSFNGDGGNTEAGFGDEEDDDDDEVVDSSQQASGETGFPQQQGTVSHPGPGASTPRTHPRLPPGPSRRRRDLCCMCFNDHRIFSFPEASEA
ncbi:myb/SANT-like DNA-binding domain-containing protein 7 [Caretta caretta]|uniref:myb/SANT-like DNA-binding domain-containing protein 7 n=1 Tax=Caretta caretta TaxID=8467 RepID=UPI003F4C87A5